MHTYRDGTMVDAKEKNDTSQTIMEQCASINLRRFSRLVTNEYNDALRPTGLRTTQLAVLVAIGAGDKRSLTDIADTLSMDISTLTRSVAILEQKGLAICQAAGGRKKRVVLTTEGHNTIQNALPYWHKAQQEFYNKIGAETHDLLAKAIQIYASASPLV